MFQITRSRWPSTAPGSPLANIVATATCDEASDELCRNAGFLALHREGGAGAGWQNDDV